MSYTAPSDFQEITRLEEEQNKIRDILFFRSVNSIGREASAQGFGRKGQSFGSELGGKSWFPVERSVTEFDESGAATGVFDRLDLNALTMIVTGIPAIIPLKFIQFIGNGKIFSLTPKAGKTLQLQPGGNIDVSSTINITDSQTALFQFFTDTGKVKIVGSTGGSGGVSNIISQLDSKVEVIDDGVSPGRVEVTTDGTALHMRIGLVGGQKTINIQSSELTNVNVLRSPTTNQNIDSVSGGWRYEVPFGGAVHQFRVHNGAIFVEVGHFDAGGLNMDDLNISNVSGISFSNLGVSINDSSFDMNFGVPADQKFKFNSGIGLIMTIGLVSGQKTIDFQSSELLNVNVLRSPTTNQNIDSISGGWRYEVPSGGAVHQFRVRNSGDTAWIEVGKFAAFGFDAQGFNIIGINALTFDVLGNAISQTATDFTLSILSGSFFQFKIDGIPELTLTASTLGLVGNNIGQVGRVQLNELVTPPTPPANSLYVYGKLDGGFTKLFYKQEDGTEIGPLGLGGGGSGSFADNVFDVHNASDITKKFVFDASGIFTGRTITIKSASSVNVIITLPAVTGILASLAAPFQSFTGQTDFQNDVFLGSSVSHRVQINGRLDSNIIPKFDATYSLGEDGLSFRKLILANSNLGRLRIPVGTNLFDT